MKTTAKLLMLTTLLGASLSAAPIHDAVKSKNISLIKELILNDLDCVNTYDESEMTPLHYAVLDNNHLITEILLENDTEPRAQNNDGLDALGLAQQQGKSWNRDQIICFLECAYDGIKPSAIPMARLEPVFNARKVLHNAASAGNLAEVQRLITERPSCVNARGDSGETPLHHAVTSHRTEVVELLIANGADVNAQSCEGLTPLHCAVAEGRIEIVLHLINGHANMNVQDNNGWTPLHAATRYDHTEIVELLLNQGADTSIVNNEGKNPLDPELKS